jgi:hypothetical protein
LEFPAEQPARNESGSASAQATANDECERMDEPPTNRRLPTDELRRSERRKKGGGRPERSEDRADAAEVA